MSSSEDSENELPKVRKKPGGKRRGRPPLKGNGKAKFMCTGCKKSFQMKTTAISHSKFCKKNKERANNLTCMWCGLTFVNRGNLSSHAFHIHGDSSYKSVITLEQHKEYKFKCIVCDKYFPQNYLLRYHIRRVHFNLKARVPYAELKKINQVWFEKVLNSNYILEIKKTGKNTLVMRKLDENTAIKVPDINTKIIDLTHMYPTNSNDTKAVCRYCNQVKLKRDLKKHIEEVHLNRRKHQCNNCNRAFKRSYQYLQHRCDKIMKVRGVKQGTCPEFRISNVESLQFPLG